MRTIWFELKKVIPFKKLYCGILTSNFGKL